MQPSMEREAVYEDEIDLRELVATLVRRKWWIAGVTLIALAVAGVLSFAVLPPTYAVSVQVAPPANQALLDMIYGMDSAVQGSAGSTGNATGQSEIQAYTAMASSDVVLAQVAREVGWQKNYSELQQSFAVQADSNGGTLTVTARAPSAEEAYRLATAWRRAFVGAAVNLARQQLDLQIQVGERRVAGEEAALDRLQATLGPGGNPSTATMISVAAVGQVLAQAQGDLDRLLALRQSVDAVAAPTVLQDARLPEAPVAPRKALNLAVALVLGLMVGVLAAFFADYWARGQEAVPEAAADGATASGR
ncbi:MAG: hypothetical protein K6U79_03495 [Firmicutes bacterium]|nr:hypothetical protein [Bacillota bacterium]